MLQTNYHYKAQATPSGSCVSSTSEVHMGDTTASGSTVTSTSKVHIVTTLVLLMAEN
jgi:hypothetical protein